MHLRRKKSRAELAREAVHDFADRAADLTKDAATALAPRAEAARGAAGDAFDQASALVRDDILPKVRDDYAPKARDTFVSRRDEYVPKVKEAAKPVVAAVVARTPIETKKKGSKRKKLLVLLGLAGVAAFIATKLKSDPVSAPAPRPAPPTPPRPTAVPDPSPEGGDTPPVTTEVPTVDGADPKHSAKSPPTDA